MLELGWNLESFSKRHLTDHARDIGMLCITTISGPKNTGRVDPSAKERRFLSEALLASTLRDDLVTYMWFLRMGLNTWVDPCEDQPSC
jgi:hypothetical protein